MQKSQQLTRLLITVVLSMKLFAICMFVHRPMALRCSKWCFGYVLCMFCDLLPEHTRSLSSSLHRKMVPLSIRLWPLATVTLIPVRCQLV